MIIGIPNHSEAKLSQKSTSSYHHGEHWALPEPWPNDSIAEQKAAAPAFSNFSTCNGQDHETCPGLSVE